MEAKVFLTLEGQECQQGDINTIGATAAYADDRVLWELVRMLPRGGSVDRAVMPTGFRTKNALPGLATDAFIQPSPGPHRTIRVLPFRAIVGPIAVGVNLEALRGIRSGYSIGQLDELYTSIVLTANADVSHARWTLIYAVVRPDLIAAPVDRFVKDADSDVVEALPITVAASTTVTLGTLDGAASATPAKPAAPADGFGAYYIPLAYVWVPASFDAAEFPAGYIHECAPVATIHSALGVANLQPANQQHKIGGVVDAAESPFTTTQRPAAYLPPTMTGVEERLIALELKSSHPSHFDGAVVDDSVDWRYRVFQWTSAVGALASGNLSTASPHGIAPDCVPSAWGSPFSAFGQSLWDDTPQLADGLIGADPTITVSDGQGIAVQLRTAAAIGPDGSCVALYVRETDGALVVRYNAAITNGSIFIWLRATGQYGNYRP